MLSSTDCIEEGKYGLQDFDNDVMIKFGQHDLGRISEIHGGIIEKERSFKELQARFHKDAGEKMKRKNRSSPPMTNFLLLKVGLYGVKNNQLFQRTCDLHEMVNGLETYVFPSSFTNDLTECCKGCHIPKNENLPENIFKNYQRNVVARGQCPGINQKIFDITVCNVRAAATIVQSMRQNLCLEIDKYDIDKEDEMLADIEEAMQFHLKDIGKGRESYLTELSKFVGIFGTLKQEYYHVYRNCNAIGQYISKVASPSVKLDMILPHMHSTHKICDNCHLQLAGAMHNWLCEGIVKR